MAISFPSFCHFLEPQFLVLRMLRRDVRKDEWNRLRDSTSHFDLQKLLKKCSDSDLQYHFKLKLCHSPAIFLQSIAFSVECRFKPSLFERLDIIQTSRIQSWRTHQCLVSKVPSFQYSQTPKLIFLSVNACHRVFRLHLYNF